MDGRRRNNKVPPSKFNMMATALSSPHLLLLLFPLLLLSWCPAEASFRFNFSQAPNGTLNLRPVIGLLLADFVDSSLPNVTSYLGAANVKAVEAAGARVAPIFLWRDRDYYQKVFETTNGLILQGAEPGLIASGYSQAAMTLWDLALNSPKEKRTNYPIWGTCLGSELLTALSANRSADRDAVRVAFGKLYSPCQSRHLRTAAHVFSAPEWNDSLLGSNMPESVLEILRSEASSAVFNNHGACLRPPDFDNMAMGSFWQRLLYSKDRRGRPFLTLLEARDYPIWASGFHPEKPAFEWNPLIEQIPHDEDAIFANSYFTEFFVAVARRSLNGFATDKEEEDALIYNYSPTFVGKRSGINLRGGDFALQQAYLFEDGSRGQQQRRP